MEKIELVMQNVEEVVTREELEKLFESKKEPTCYVGYEPSGHIHLGHMLTVNKLIDMQTAGFYVTVLLADRHAYLNQKGELDEIRKTADMNSKIFTALGLDPKKTRFVLGSEFQLSADYSLDVLRLAGMTSLARARRSMDEVSRDAENPMVSQMIYPLMQAADIAHLGIDVAVGGIDQRKIHMLARENLTRIGFPAPICLHTPILSGLNGKKMSSSEGNLISLEDDELSVEKKIRKAYCPERDVTDNPVLQLMQLHVFPRVENVRVERLEKHGGDSEYSSFDALKQDYVDGKIHPADIKATTTRYLNDIIKPAREKLQEVMN